MKKVAVFYGSPRKNGVSNKLAEQVGKGAKDAGAEVVFYDLNQEGVRGCQSCFFCRGNDMCAVKDPLTPMYDDIKEYKKFYNSTIPWNNKDFYKERTLFKEYNEKNIPNWIGIKNDIKFNNIQFKILSFSPFVFHHLRLIDNISIDDILSSLDPVNNMKKIKSMKVSGGRGSNCIINTWDKKFIIKTIEKTERKILIEKMLINYHCLMKESTSLLSRIYGVFKIE